MLTRQTFTGKGYGQGTCGEFVQGTLPNGQNFHVPCRINRRTEITVSLKPSKTTQIELERSKLDHTRKMEVAAIRTLNLISAKKTEGKENKDSKDRHSRGRHSRGWSIKLERKSELDIGKGMGSSTADITGAVRAVGDALKQNITETETGQIAASIESTDGSMYTGLNAVEQATGEILESFEWNPHFRILMLIPSETLNTEIVTSKNRKLDSKTYTEILANLHRAAETQDDALFAEQVTRSAMLNQKHVPNRCFELLRNQMKNCKALGTVGAHTGTVGGLLFKADNTTANLVKEAEEKLQRHIRETDRLEAVWVV